MKTSITLIAVAFVLVLSSCSGARYGHLPMVKRQKQAVAQHTPHKKRLNTKTTVVPKKIEIEKAVTNDEINTNYVVAVPPAPSKNNDFTFKSRKNRTEKNISEEQTIVKEHSLSPWDANKNLKNSAAEKQMVEHNWLWYIIVGLIFLLLAAIIPWTLGWIFYIVGVIAIIIGLLALLGIV